MPMPDQGALRARYVDGSTRRRLKGSDTSGRYRLKTGLLNGVRAAAGFGLTESGRSFYEHSARILADLDEAESAIQQEHGDPLK